MNYSNLTSCRNDHWGIPSFLQIGALQEISVPPRIPLPNAKKLYCHICHSPTKKSMNILKNRNWCFVKNFFVCYRNILHFWCFACFATFKLSDVLLFGVVRLHWLHSTASWTSAPSAPQERGLPSALTEYKEWLGGSVKTSHIWEDD